MPYLTMHDGTKLYYEDKGRGKTILFAHGLNSSHLKIKNFIDEFKDEYRLVYYDQRGHEASDSPMQHMNVQTLGQDMNEIIEYLGLEEVTVIGHSMGAATIFSYVNRFGCGRLNKIVAVDMSPYMGNAVWRGGIANGTWTNEDFLQDMERIFDDVGAANWHIVKTMMNPKLANTPAEMEGPMIAACRNGCNPFVMASLWFSLFRTDQREAIDKITVPFLYIMPETPLYSMVNVDFIREHVKGGFKLENCFPGTTHTILMEKPHEVAEKIKVFIKS